MSRRAAAKWYVSASWGEGRAFPFYASATSERQAEKYAQMARDAGAIDVSIRRDAGAIDVSIRKAT